MLPFDCTDAPLRLYSIAPSIQLNCRAFGRDTAKVRHRNAEGSPSRWRAFGQLVEAKERFRESTGALQTIQSPPPTPLMPPSVSPEGEGALRMGKLMQMLMPTPMPKLPNLLKHLEGPSEEEVAVLVIDLDGAVVCQ